jgi:hypothetical protein
MLVCSNCQHENEVGQSHCSQCDTPLALGFNTLPVPLLSDTDQLTDGLSPVEFADSTVSKSAIALHIPGEAQPIVIVDMDEIILGRHSHDNQPLTVDLTDYRAYTLGVSRRHAVINWTDDGYTLSDLGGANGTWLNRERLKPHKPYRLQTGDLILLGQLSLYVSFPTLTQENGSTPSAKTTE